MKRIFSFAYGAAVMVIVFSVLVFSSGCGIGRDDDSRRSSDETKSEARKTNKKEETSASQEETGVSSERETTVSEQVETQLTSFETEQDVLFDMYTIPVDWPRVVPLMSEFQVTVYEWTDEGMYVAGYGNVSMSRASNYYTNAKKIHVSSNIWEQDPETESVTEGENQIFNYVAEGQRMTVVLTESDESSIWFEIYYISID